MTDRQRMNLQVQKQQKMHEERAKSQVAAVADPNLYQYDEVYDDIQAKREKEAAAAAAAVESSKTKVGVMTPMLRIHIPSSWLGIEIYCNSRATIANSSTGT